LFSTFGALLQLMMRRLLWAVPSCVLEGAAGQLNLFLPGPNVHMMAGIRDFFGNSLFLWIKPEHLLC